MAHWRGFLDADARGGRYLPWKEVARSTGLSRTTAWRLQKRDDFPAPYSISPGRVAYREDEVEAWRASRAVSPSRGGADGKPPAKAGAPRSPEIDPQRGPERRASEPTPEAPKSPVTPSPPAADPRLERKAVARRRSQHAQAIAQQMLFDF